MAKTKFTPEIVRQIIDLCLITDETNEQLARGLGCSAWLIGELCRKHLTAEQRKARFSRLARKSKQGSRNPMFDRRAEKHPNYRGGYINSLGYRVLHIFGHKIYEHVHVWQEHYKQIVPTGFVVHHIDCDKLNNSIDNLQLLTVGEHMKLHNQIRKEQRLLCTSQA